jgi:hypothetical protein
MSFQTTITREIDVDVDYVYSRGQREAWGYYGGTPAEPESVEIVSVKDKATGRDVELTEAEVNTLEQEALEHHEGLKEAAAESRAEDAAEQRRERTND